ncbi:hypothetical protein ID866_3526 [Astraeus odoratus]|nr:hypothetical protein ID866_3526 [Astraeus odoratus]
MSAVQSTGLALPVEILIVVMESLDLHDLINLSYTSKFMHALVNEFGWSTYLRLNERPSWTLDSARRRWSSKKQVQYNALADRSWSRAQFIARPLSRSWAGNLQPVLAVSSSRLLVAAGRIIYSYGIRDPLAEGHGTRLVYEGSFSFTLRPGVPDHDITGITFISDGGEDRTVCLGFADGYVEQFKLPVHDSSNWRLRIAVSRVPEQAVHFHERDVVEDISYSRNSLLSLSSWGSVTLRDLSSSSALTTTLQLGVRSWSSHLSMSASTPYVTFGITCTAHPTPLLVHHITPSKISSTPSVVLDSPRHRPSAVYGITQPPPSSPLGPSDQLIVSGWYDGAVRVHDLRVSGHSVSSASGEPTVLDPVLTLQDPWSPESVYCVSCGGGSASFVAAGTARYSVVAFWDVRQPTKGWSVHAPGNDSSPVYSVILESSRLFGATQSRSFVYDFGPGVTRDTYPSVPTSPNRIIDRHLRLNHDGVDYYVLKYNHNRAGLQI